MATTKMSLTLDADLVEQARLQVGERGLSRYVSEALRLRLQHDRLTSWLADAETRSGPIPEDVIREAERLWPER